jgi:dienelactone hydrolase
VREHPVLLPTQIGPVGGIVTEPSGEQRGAFVLLQGIGPPARAGINALWASVARELSSLGLVVLRFDFACEGDSTLAGAEVERGVGWRRSADLAILRELAPWFLERTGESDLLLAGSCHGGRVALEFAASEPIARGLFLIAPYLWHREPHLGRKPKEGEPAKIEPVAANGPVLGDDDDLHAGFRTALTRGPVYVLVGEGEEVDYVRPFGERLQESGPTFELEVAPGMPIHPVGHPHQQAIARRWLLDRVTAEVAAMSAARPSPA